MPIRKSNDTLFYLIGIIPVVWLALLLAQSLGGGLPELRIYGRAERKLLRAPDEIVAAALSAVGRSGYDYRTNNCEHFSNECAFGEHYSRQSGEGNE